MVETTDGQAGDVRLPPVFTEEEIRHIQLVALSPDTLGSRISSLLAYLATPAIFGLYGLFSGSLKVLGIAFIVLLLLILWGLFTEVRGHAQVLLNQSVMRKLADRIAGDRKG